MIHIHDRRLRSRQFIGVVQPLRTPNAEDQANEIRVAATPGESKHGHQGHNAGATAAEEQDWCVAGPNERAAHRPPHFEFVPRAHLIVKKYGHFISGMSLDRYLDLT
jgi:hypothetical protein